MKQTQNTQQRKNAMPWTFVRALIRVYIGWAEAHLFTHNNVPQWVKDLLPVCEDLIYFFFCILIIDPTALSNFKASDLDGVEPEPVSEPVEISIEDFRRRLARLKAIAQNPAEETARLKAWIESLGIRFKKIAGLRPMSIVVIKHDALAHACAQSKITPQARPPPNQTKIEVRAGEATASAAVCAEGNGAAIATASHSHSQSDLRLTLLLPSLLRAPNSGVTDTQKGRGP